MTLTNFLQNIINVLPQAAGFYPTTQDRTTTVAASKGGRCISAGSQRLLYLCYCFMWQPQSICRNCCQGLRSIGTMAYRHHTLPRWCSYSRSLYLSALSTSIPLVVGRSYTILYLAASQQRRNGKNCGNPTGFLLAVETAHCGSLRTLLHLLPQHILLLRSIYCYNNCNKITPEEDITARVIQY